MKGISNILILRVKQLMRATGSVGWVLLLIGLPLIGILALGIFEASEEGWHLSLIFAAMIYGIHFSRDDRQHLISIGYIPRLVFAAEYLSLALILGVLNFLQFLHKLILGK